MIAVVYVSVGVVLPASALAADGAFESGVPQAVLVDAGTGAVLYQKNAHLRVPPSSMTKLMTVYVMFDQMRKGQLKEDDEFTVSENAWRKGGSKMFVKVHDSVKVADLLQGIVVQSGNDACVTVAEGIAASEDAFADLMNTEAEKLGLVDSHFLNSSGWPEEGHYSSVYDLSMLALQIIKEFPEKYKLFSEREFTYNGIRQSNRNKLLYRDIGADGLKTGHTEDGGYGVVVSAVRDGRRLVAVVNGAKSDGERTREAERLLQYGFRYFVTRTLAPKDAVVGEADVWLGTSSEVKLRTGTAVVAAIPKTGKASLPEMKVVYEAPLDAPVKAGDKVAELQLFIGGQKMQSYPLFAVEDVEKAGPGMRVLKRIYYYLTNKMDRWLAGEPKQPAPAVTGEGAGAVAPAVPGTGAPQNGAATPAGEGKRGEPESAHPSASGAVPGGTPEKASGSEKPAEAPSEDAAATKKQAEQSDDGKQTAEPAEPPAEDEKPKHKGKEKRHGKAKHGSGQEEPKDPAEGEDGEAKDTDKNVKKEQTKDKEEDRVNVAPPPRPAPRSERQPDE